MTNVAFTGGQSYDDSALVSDILAAISKMDPNLVILVGDDKNGLDLMVREWGYSNRQIMHVYKASKLLGKGGKPARDEQMINDAALLYAFPGGNETDRCIKLAREKGIKVVQLA